MPGSHRAQASRHRGRVQHPSLTLCLFGAAVLYQPVLALAKFGACVRTPVLVSVFRSVILFGYRLGRLPQRDSAPSVAFAPEPPGRSVDSVAGSDLVAGL